MATFYYYKSSMFFLLAITLLVCSSYANADDVPNARIADSKVAFKMPPFISENWKSLIRKLAPGTKPKAPVATGGGSLSCGQTVKCYPQEKPCKPGQYTCTAKNKNRTQCAAFCYDPSTGALTKRPA